MDMVRDTDDDKEFADELEGTHEAKRLSRILFRMRASRGVTQKELAEKLETTQGRISKLEQASVNSIKVSDLLDYAHSLGYNVGLEFHTRQSAVDHIEHNISEIRKNLDFLASLAQKAEDQKLHRLIRKFFEGTTSSLLKEVAEAASELPQLVPPHESEVRFSIPAELGEQDDTKEVNNEAMTSV